MMNAKNAMIFKIDVVWTKADASATTSCLPRTDDPQHDMRDWNAKLRITATVRDFAKDSCEL